MHIALFGTLKAERLARAALLTLLSALSASAFAQSGVTPPGPLRDAAGNIAQASTINLLEAKLATLEKKVADLEQKLATQQTRLNQQSADIDVLKPLPTQFKNHSHDVVIYSIDYSLADVKDINNVKKTVVVPGPSWGNPKGQTGGPKVAPSNPF